MSASTRRAGRCLRLSAAGAFGRFSLAAPVQRSAIELVPAFDVAAARRSCRSCSRCVRAAASGAVRRPQAAAVGFPPFRMLPDARGVVVRRRRLRRASRLLLLAQFPRLPPPCARPLAALWQRSMYCGPCGPGSAGSACAPESYGSLWAPWPRRDAPALRIDRAHRLSAGLRPRRSRCPLDPPSGCSPPLPSATAAGSGRPCCGAVDLDAAGPLGRPPPPSFIRAAAAPGGGPAALVPAAGRADAAFRRRPRGRTARRTLISSVHRPLAQQSGHSLLPARQGHLSRASAYPGPLSRPAAMEPNFPLVFPQRCPACRPAP